MTYHLKHTRIDPSHYDGRTELVQVLDENGLCVAAAAFKGDLEAQSHAARKLMRLVLKNDEL